MTVQYAVDLRNAQLDALTDFIGGGAKLRIYNGTRPSSGGTPTTLLAELVCGTPFAPAASGGAVSANVISDDAAADATGTATWFRIVKADGTTYCMDGDVGLAGPADLVLSTVSLISGVAVAVTSLIITRGNI